MNCVHVPSGWQRVLCLGMLGAVAMSVSVSTYGQPDRQVRLTEQEVACQPAGDWLHQFPAISHNNERIAVLTEPHPESGIVSLQVLRVLDQDLTSELEFPLFRPQYVNWKECIEEIEAGAHEATVGSREAVNAANAHLSDNEYGTMLALDSRSIYELTMDDLPGEPEVVISWGRYYISFDYRKGNLTVDEYQCVDDGILAATENCLGQRYFELQLSKTHFPGGVGASGSCMGTPVPLGIWTNHERESPGEVAFLVRIGYISSGECSVPDEWAVTVVER